MLQFKNILFFCLCFGLIQCKSAKKTESPAPKGIKTGAERTELYLSKLKGKSVGLVVNQTSVVNQTHLVDFLLSKQIKLTKIFSPEHGFRGDSQAGEKIDDTKDAKTGLPIISLHGNKYKPTAIDLKDIDVLLFDIQDVGVRFYTYISTLSYVMEACAENDKKLIVFDRPNPNGHYVDGPVLDMEFKSFVGIAPIPVVHGLTIGEFAMMSNGEKWLSDNLKCDLEVIPCANYTHDSYYEIQIPPSPNLKTMRSILLYPSICFFEGTVVSLGRGTNNPFEIAGHPALKGKYEYNFKPMPNAGSSNPPQNGKLCYGVSFTDKTTEALFAQKQLNFQYLFDFYKIINKNDTYFLKNNFFDKLAGTDTFRKAIIAGKTEAEIRKSWEPPLEKYKKIRAQYLLYP
ncbi:MAG: exo-beta-N-acetylmuramidase NamZ family protein [Saprospiraceae bacterium]